MSLLSLCFFGGVGNAPVSMADVCLQRDTLHPGGRGSSPDPPALTGVRAPMARQSQPLGANLINWPLSNRFVIKWFMVMVGLAFASAALCRRLSARQGWLKVWRPSPKTACQATHFYGEVFSREGG